MGKVNLPKAKAREKGVHAKVRAQSVQPDSVMLQEHPDRVVDLTQVTTQQAEPNKYAGNGQALAENAMIRIKRNVHTSTHRFADSSRKANAKRGINVTIFTKSKYGTNPKANRQA